MTSKAEKNNDQQQVPWILGLVAILALIIILPFFLVFGAIYVASRHVMTFLYCLLVRLFWIPKGKCVLFVSSDSPTWKNYINANYLPKIKDKTILLNYSERSKWKRSLEVLIFQHWSGFRPWALVFKPWWRPQKFEFVRAFRDFKHGKDNKLKQIEELFFNLVT